MARDRIRAHLKLWGGDSSNPRIAPSASSWRQEGRLAQWFVYTLYAEHVGVKPPLYVGVTGNLYGRLCHHRSEQAWWPLVGDIVIEQFDTKDDAFEAEHWRIFSLKPLFNIAGNAHTPRFNPAALTEVTL